MLNERPAFIPSNDDPILYKLIYLGPFYYKFSMSGDNEDKKRKICTLNKSCLVMVEVQLASRSFQHKNSRINRIFQQNNPRCNHQIQIQKPGTRPNSASPIASSQQLQLTPLTNRKHTTPSTSKRLRHTRAQKPRYRKHADQSRLEGGFVGLTTRDSYRIEPRGSNRRPAWPASRFAPSPPAVATSGSGGGVDRGGQERRRDWKRGNFEVGGTASHIGGVGQITGLPLYTCSAALGLVPC
jgi:hypothetical protein